MSSDCRFSGGGAYRKSGQSAGRSASLARARYFDQAPALYVVDVTVDRNVRGDQRMLADAAHVLPHALLVVRKCLPLDEVPVRGPVAVLRIAPFLAVEAGRLQVILQQVPDDLVGK